MNCLEVRRRLLIDPSRIDRETRAHLASCAGCKSESERLLELDEEIRRALQVEPAPGLHSRILLAEVLRRSRIRFGARFLAIAAALLLSAGAAIWTVRVSGPVESLPEQSLSESVLAHIQSEIEYLRRDDKVTPQALALMLTHFGVRLRDDLGQVRYLSHCRIGGSDGVHLILEGATAPITVLLMPGEQAGHRETVDGGGFQGVVVPSGPGSMAVVGGRDEPLDKLIEKLDIALAWES